MPDTTPAALIPHAVPANATSRLLLYAMRRMAQGGIDDARAASAMFNHLRLGWRRPLLFLRAFMLELARVSQRPIALAPCCCPRMTEGEAMLLLAIDCGGEHPEVACDVLSRISGAEDVRPALAAAQALAQAFEDLGRPLRL